MGQASAILKAFSCHDCAMYVCNAMKIDSECMDCCKLHIETTEIAVPDDDSTYSMEVVGCCEARKT